LVLNWLPTSIRRGQLLTASSTIIHELSAALMPRRRLAALVYALKRFPNVVIYPDAASRDQTHHDVVNRL
jgi:hypothetical protein